MWCPTWSCWRSRVEHLHACFVVTVEGRRTTTGQAELVVGRVGKPHTDTVEVDAHAVTVD